MMRLLSILLLLAPGSHADDACAVDPWIKPGRAAEQVPSRLFAPYVAPQPAKSAAKTSIVFVHLSKSAGSTMKKALAHAARRTNRRPPITLFRRTWPRFLAACAKGRAACRADLYAGTNAFGACEYVEAAARRRGEDRRCVYATVLRNPIDRVESSWRYFCLNGAERRKGWTNAMKRAGVAPVRRTVGADAVDAERPRTVHEPRLWRARPSTVSKMRAAADGPPPSGGGPKRTSRRPWPTSSARRAGPRRRRRGPGGRPAPPRARARRPSPRRTPRTPRTPAPARALAPSSEPRREHCARGRSRARAWMWCGERRPGAPTGRRPTGPPGLNHC